MNGPAPAPQPSAHLASDGTSPALLEARSLTKRFGGVTALHNVSFDLQPGEIHALCGENGAGKSTLIKTLSGLHPHGSYEGEIRLDGVETRFRSLADADRAGLAVIYQELALVESMTVAENIFLGRERRHGPWIDWARTHRDAATLLAKFQIDIHPETPVNTLGVGQKQLVEIVKALSKEARLLILDEPTAALAGAETGILLRILRELRAQGVSIIYISHKLNEVMSISDRITVLRDGASVATMATAETDIPSIIRHMVGRKIEADRNSCSTSSAPGAIAPAARSSCKGSPTLPPPQPPPSNEGWSWSPMTANASASISTCPSAQICRSRRCTT